jgi:hypothetical protein
VGEGEGTCGSRTPKRTSLGRPLRAAERPATSTASAAVRASMPVVEPRPLAATVASLGPPKRVGVRGEGSVQLPVHRAHSALRWYCSSLYACADGISGCTWGRDSVNVRPARRGDGQKGLVGVSEQ